MHNSFFQSNLHAESNNYAPKKKKKKKNMNKKIYENMMHDDDILKDVPLPGDLLSLELVFPTSLNISQWLEKKKINLYTMARTKLATNKQILVLIIYATAFYHLEIF